MFRFSPRPNNAHMVRWRGWGQEAFQEAQVQNKPIVLFLCAFWCGVCQRMDETSFSNDEIITLLNAYFIPVRVEDAQRPDIDVRYNQNGWPTVVFMTPSGGHMLSVNSLPQKEFGDVLVRVHLAFTEGRAEIEEGIARSELEASQKHLDQAPQVEPASTIIDDITEELMGLADQVHGGYGQDAKFPDVEANEFLLRRYHATGERRFLDHVTLTLDKMRAGKIHDGHGGGFFRYSSKPDWNEPHREKLLRDQAGILDNHLHAFLITGNQVYKEVAEEIIEFLNTKLTDHASGAFYGCEDQVRGVRTGPGGAGDGPPGWFTIIDNCVYTDASATTISAYLNAWRVLGRQDCRERALRALDLLWSHCRAPEGGMYHYFDGEPHVTGLLRDDVWVGEALLDAHKATGEARYLERAMELAEGILLAYRNPSGGFYDIKDRGLANLRFRLTSLNENGAAAAFLTHLHTVTDGDERLKKGARWALLPFAESYCGYGVASAIYGHTLAEYLDG